jgi:hypothetical protein
VGDIGWSENLTQNVLAGLNQCVKKYENLSPSLLAGDIGWSKKLTLNVLTD